MLMTGAPDYWVRAKRELARRDPVLAAIIRDHPRHVLTRRGDAFFTLARSITGQQLSVRAAQRIWDRLSDLSGQVTPERIAALDAASLRACGLSERKTQYLQALCRHFVDGSLSVMQWASWEDEAIISELVQIRGVGRWTAEMFLMFHLLRPDVLPLGDLGLQNAMQNHYAVGRKLSERRKIGRAHV